jgi:RNA polymerase primary sigma factor
LPAHFAEKYAQVKRASMELLTELDREPEPEEIADRLKLPIRLVFSILQITSETESSSMSVPIDGDENACEFGDLLEDQKTLSPVDIIEAKEKLQEIVSEARAVLIKLAMLPRFDKRYSQIFRMRHGLDGTFFRRPTLEDVALKFGVTRERIRQIIVTCWQRLNSVGVSGDEDSFVAKLSQIEELESITGTLTKI